MRAANFRNVMWQVLVVLHRYLGVAVGLLMVMWFASGIVMMYVGFPRVTEEERARTLEPIAWQGCCRFPQRLAADDAQVSGAGANLLRTQKRSIHNPRHPYVGLWKLHPLVARPSPEAHV